MFNKAKACLSVCLYLSILSGCSASSSHQNNNQGAENNYSQKIWDECREISPVNISLVTSGIISLATWNPIAAAIVGGATYFTVNSEVFDCDKSE
jgi:hypothetical protein